MGLVGFLATGIASFLPAIGAVSLVAGAGFGIPAGTFAIAQLIAGGILAGGLIGAQLLLRPKVPQGSVDPGSAQETFSSSEGPEVRAIGRVRLGGLKAFGDTNDPDRFRLICHCKGPISLTETYYLGGREITVDADSGGVTSPPWFSNGNNLVVVLEKDGDGTETAWADLITAFPTLWTSDHRVRGIAQSLVDYKSPGLASPKFLQLYQAGVPDFEKLIRAEEVYDPRTATTTWSDNGILCALHLLLSCPEFTIDMIDVDDIKLEADKADVMVDTRAGTEQRARASGVWTSEQKRADMMQDILRSIGAEIVALGELYSIRLIDDDRSGEVTIPARHISEFSWKSGPDAVERPNLCRLTYYAPEHNYQMTEIALQAFDDFGVYIGPAWARVQDEIDAYGEKPFDLQLPFCSSAPQAQRIARRLFSLARADTGTITANQYGFAAWGCTAIDVEMPDDLGTITIYNGAPKDAGQGKVEITFQSAPVLSPWDTDTDEVDPPDQLPSFQYPSPLTTPDAPDAAAVVTYPDSSPTPIVTRFHVVIPNDISGFSEDVQDPPQMEMTYRIYSGSPPLAGAWQGMHEFVGVVAGLPPTLIAHGYVEGDLSGENVDVRFRTFDGTNGSDWSDLFNVTPAAVNTAPSDPTISHVVNGPNVDVTARAPNSLDVAYLVVTGDFAPAGNHNIRPGESLIWSSNDQSAGDHVFTAQAFTSDGTASGTASTTAHF